MKTSSSLYVEPGTRISLHVSISGCVAHVSLTFECQLTLMTNLVLSSFFILFLNDGIQFANILFRIFCS